MSTTSATVSDFRRRARRDLAAFLLTLTALVTAQTRANQLDNAIYPGDVVTVAEGGGSLTRTGAEAVRLPSGLRLEVFEVRGEYARVTATLEGKAVIGWVPRSAVTLNLELADGSPIRRTVVADDDAVQEALRSAGAVLGIAPPGIVVAVDARQSRLADDDLASLGRLAQVARLDLGGLPITGAGLQHLAGHAGIRELYLDDCPIGDGGLSAVATMPMLEVLSLAGTRIAGTGLGDLSRLPYLKVLNLSRTAVDDRALAGLAGLDRLEVLALADTKVEGPGLASLAALARLNALNLDRCALGGTDLTALDRLVGLRMLYLRGSGVAGSGIRGLRERHPLLNIDAAPPERDGDRGSAQGGPE